ncbi:hypothetical protein L596_018654 [Steinernema carpocapsae]|uniref:Uncharacterized protein n=1 Tax=Steinernema carpocapsae TaxID=34508 RepID=A0A4U5N595_STECR|nr:hypothetical protein L596_018654 [Steinernema carpocapsae]
MLILNFQSYVLPRINHLNPHKSRNSHFSFFRCNRTPKSDVLQEDTRVTLQRHADVLACTLNLNLRFRLSLIFCLFPLPHRLSLRLKSALISAELWCLRNPKTSAARLIPNIMKV